VGDAKRRAAATWRPAEAHGCAGGGARRRSAKDGLPATISHGKNTKRKRRARGSYQGAWRGGRGVGGVDRGGGATAAGGAPAACVCARGWRGGGAGEGEARARLL
jgi:hypothetical protein